ncbi:MAG: TonB-dependent receptor, partial [Peristeroidobacter soli]
FTYADAWWALGADPASSIELYPDTNVIKSRTIGDPFRFMSGDGIEESTDTFVYALAGKWAIGDKLTLAADVSIQDSSFETQFIAMRTNNAVFIPQLNMDFNAGGGVPSWHFNDDAAMLNPANWTAADLYQNKGAADGDAATFQLDGDYDVAGDSDEGWFKKLSFGVRYDDRGAIHYQPAPTASPFLPAPATLAQMPEGMLWHNKNFFDGGDYIPGSWLVANGYWIQDHAAEVRGMYNMPVDGPALLRSYDVTEKTSSVYVQADFDIGEKLHGNAGVRYVQVDTPLVFNDLVTGGAPIHRKNSVDDLMPSVTLRYDITDDLRV